MNREIEAAARAAGIGVTMFFDGARFELPPRPAKRGLGLGMLALGVVITLFMCLWMGGPIKGAMDAPPPMRWFLLGFGLLGLPGLAAGLAMLAAGLATAYGRSRAVVDTTDPFAPERAIARPVKARSTIQDIEGGFAIHCPPAGLRKGSHGLFFFSLRWLAYELRRRLQLPADVP